MLLDYHMHLAGDEEPYSQYSFTYGHIGRYVAMAIDAGVSEIGFTDHVYRFSVARDWIDAMAGASRPPPTSRGTSRPSPARAKPGCRC